MRQLSEIVSVFACRRFALVFSVVSFRPFSDECPYIQLEWQILLTVTSHSRRRLPRLGSFLAETEKNEQNGVVLYQLDFVTWQTFRLLKLASNSLSRKLLRSRGNEPTWDFTEVDSSGFVLTLEHDAMLLPNACEITLPHSCNMKTSPSNPTPSTWFLDRV